MSCGILATLVLTIEYRAECGKNGNLAVEKGFF